jgi:hypothetical protein
MAGFSGKLNSIPLEFRSYHPQPPEMSNNESSGTFILNKKRGRPIGSTTTDPNDKKVVKKQTKPTITDSNSIMKYFGSKVAVSIAQPSKSVSTLPEIEFNVSSLSISSVESSTLSIFNTADTLNDSLEYSTISTVEEIIFNTSLRTKPYYESSENTSGTMSASTTIPMILPVIIEEEPVPKRIEILYGLDWKDCSCSFDTVVTVLIYIYFSLILHQREDFVQGLPFFGTIFRDINISSMESVADAKLLLMPFFMGGPEPKYAIKKTYAVEQVYHDIMGQHEGTSDLMRIHYSISKECVNSQCENLGIKVRGENRLLPFFESCTVGDTQGGMDYDIKELMENYWKRKIHYCKKCKKLLESNRTFNNQNPLFLTVSVNLMDTLLDSVISFRESDYEIFAVGYTNEVHYIARIKTHDGIYEYDGMVMHGRLQLVTRRYPFAEKIITMSGSRYKAQIVWYQKIGTVFKILKYLGFHR